MQRYISSLVLRSLVPLLAIICSSSSAFSDVCSMGQGDPPFLSSSVDNNLLLMIDNSGSMLDMAYSKDGSYCFDNQFDTTKNPPYAGNYQTCTKDSDGNCLKNGAKILAGDTIIPSTWYKWFDGVEQWSHKQYQVGDLVYYNGNIYRATKAGTSNGTTLYGDSGVDWERLLQPIWRSGTSYRLNTVVVGPATGFVYRAKATDATLAISPDTSAGSPYWQQVDTWKKNTFYTGGTYVFWKNIIYVAVKDGTSASTATAPLDDTGVSWVVADPYGWVASISYSAGEIVTYQGMTYRANSVPQAGASPLTSTNWTRIDEGYYQSIGEFIPPAQPTQCTGATYVGSDICVTKTTSPDRVTSFVASGKLLNWLMSSKFDIQKEILTGGKYVSYGDNDSRNRLVSENRGCSGLRYVKEVPLTTPANYQLTMTVRPPLSNGDTMRDDVVDNSDQTARVEILGASSGGYAAAGQTCQTAVQTILDKGLNGAQSEVGACLDTIGNTTQNNSALNHAMQYCWQKNTRNLNAVFSDCAGLYTGTSPIPPGDIKEDSAYSGYNCYGVFDSSRKHNQRQGYVGRCWNGTDCAVQFIPHPLTAILDNQGWKWTQNGLHLLNEVNNKGVESIYTKVCDSLNSNGHCNNPGWVYYMLDSNNNRCSANTGVWSSDIDGTPDGALHNDIIDPAVTVNLGDYNGVKNGDGAGGNLTTQGVACVYWAMEDFCSSLTTTQVIDPSSIGITPPTDPSAGFPAQLVDLGVLSEYQVDVPMMVMKGYSQQAAKPLGIIQKSSENLRIGTMAFNKVGSSAECPPNSPANSQITQYCLAGNKDGAQLVSPIRLGQWPVSATTTRKHIDDVVDGINLIQAGSWTPLAEAMSDAIGYYTQNTNLRLSKSDFPVDADVIYLPWDQTTSYTAGSYIIYSAVSGPTNLYRAVTDITAGGSAPDSSDKWSLIGVYKGLWNQSEKYNSNDIVKYPDSDYTTADGHFIKSKLYITTGGQAVAYPSGKLLPTTDTEVPWEPLIDPVVYPCQQNHLLVITEGSSTADVNSAIKTFVDSHPKDPSYSATQGECTANGLRGSTYLDDLTYFGQSASTDVSYASGGLYPDGYVDLPSSDLPPLWAPKNSLTTHIVVTGKMGTTTNSECDPATLMAHAAQYGGTVAPLPGESPEVLSAQLTALFNELRKRSSSGSAASVISSSRSGEGAIYQAIFWPDLERIDAAGKPYPVAWAGDVHGLFLDSNGRMHEDTDHNRQFNSATDQQVTVYFDAKSKKTKADVKNVATGAVVTKDLEQVNYLWSAGDWLSDYPVTSTGAHALDTLDTSVNRTSYISNERKRYIFTWNDVSHDGIVGANEVVPFVAGTASTDPAACSLDDASLNKLCSEFNASTPTEVNNIINWIRGANVTGYRGRTSVVSGTTFTSNWRLGDIIHSTPQTVGAPAEGYHLLYNDYSYAEFLSLNKNRRQVVYFGANDGMLHAVNAGFYSDVLKQFCLKGVGTDGHCIASGETSGADVPALGAELWAYVPYNLHPHLKCLTDPGYANAHKYFVDLKPRIFDVKIFTDDTASGGKHKNGWGTILVGGLGFGGSPVDASTLNAADTSRQFISSYFIFDITDPENPPVLLGELTRTKDKTGGQDTWVDLGYSTVIPTMVITKGTDINSTIINNWYLVFGSGPHGNQDPGLQGVSDQQAKVSVLNLNSLVNSSNKASSPMRMLNSSGSSTSSSWTFPLPGASNGFVSDPITVDFDISPIAVSGQYVSDAVYFGTIEGKFGSNPDGKPTWLGGGHLYRMTMESTHKVGVDHFTHPWDPWLIKPLIDLSSDPSDLTYQTPTVHGNAIQPITAAPAVGTDGNNFWIYFGTGRFLNANDITDRHQQSFYGIKEPMTIDKTANPATKTLNWEQVKREPPTVVTPSTAAGSKGLLSVDKIQVKEAQSIKDALLTCRGGSSASDYSCLPTGLQSPSYARLNMLENYIAGIGQCSSDTSSSDYQNNCADGWYRDFDPYGDRQRNLGQATLLGGLTTFTTYQPSSDACTAEGNSYLYAVYYKTGTSWFQNVIGDYNCFGATCTNSKMDLNRGMTTTPNLFVGSGSDAKGKVKAFVQTSTGEIKEIMQDNLPIQNVGSGRNKWKDYQRP